MDSLIFNVINKIVLNNLKQKVMTGNWQDKLTITAKFINFL